MPRKLLALILVLILALAVTSSASANVADTTPPAITITSPVNGSWTNAQTTTVHYTVSDSDPNVVCNMASGASVALSTGQNSIEISCADSSSNVAAKSVLVNVDRNAPTIQSSQSGTATNQETTYLYFGVSDDTDSSPTCNYAVGTEYSLDVGANTFLVSCSDRSGNTGYFPIEITRDETPPTIQIASPTDGLWTDDSEATLYYTVSDASGINYCTAADGAVVSLWEGENGVSVTCADNAGNVATATATVHVDLTAPSVSFDSPADGDLVKAGPLTADFTVDDADPNTTCTKQSGGVIGTAVAGANEFTVTCTDTVGNSGSATLHVTGDASPPTITWGLDAHTWTQSTAAELSFSVSDDHASSPTCNHADGDPVALSAGDNTITITCSDDVGNSATQSRTITRDNAAPSVSITSPADNSLTNQATATLHFTASDNDEASCAQTDGASVALSPGANTISVSCTDRAGNQATRSVTVTRDSVAPTITITNAASTDAASVALAFTTSDNGAGAVTCDRTPGESIALSVGANTVTIHCTDAAGNAATQSATITRIADAPVVDPPPADPVAQAVKPALAFKSKKLTLKFSPPGGASAAQACTGKAKFSVAVKGVKKPLTGNVSLVTASTSCSAGLAIKVNKSTRGKKAKATVSFAGNSYVTKFSKTYSFTVR
ncbi:MAG: hypothetical protein QM648_02165 [Solirubrobacterales bacterium]